jgi:hypothetical protein
MSGENQGHLVPADVDVWMVIHQLRFMSDLIHEIQGREKVRELIRRGDCRFASPASCWDTSESVNSGLIASAKGAAAVAVKISSGHLSHQIASSGTTGLDREGTDGCGAEEY